jgi:hypothetical protein
MKKAIREGARKLLTLIAGCPVLGRAFPPGGALVRRDVRALFRDGDGVREWWLLKGARAGVIAMRRFRRALVGHPSTNDRMVVPLGDFATPTR